MNTKITILDKPYEHVVKENLSRLSADILVADKQLLKLISPVHGLFNQITQLFFSALASDLREAKISYYTTDNEQYLLKCVQRRTAFIANSKTAARNGRRRIEKLCHQLAS